MMGNIQLPDRDIIFVAYSGGLDSVGMLFKLLTEDEYKPYHIHVHHFHLVNTEFRFEAERKAVDDTLLYFKRNDYKEFSYSETTILYPSFNSTMVPDAVMCASIATQYVNCYPKIVYYARGATKTDEGIPESNARTNLSSKVFDTLCVTGAKSLFPVREYTKKEIARFLPKELISLSWSCRRPVLKGTTPTRCGLCKTCKQLEELYD